MNRKPIRALLPSPLAAPTEYSAVILGAELFGSRSAWSRWAEGSRMAPGCSRASPKFLLRLRRGLAAGYAHQPAPMSREDRWNRPGRSSTRSAAGIVTANPHGNFDVSPDGKSFVVVRANPSSRVMSFQNLAGTVAKRRAGARATP